MRAGRIYHARRVVVHGAPWSWRYVGPATGGGRRIVVAREGGDETEIVIRSAVVSPGIVRRAIERLRAEAST